MAAQFRCVDAAFIRVAVFGGGLELPPWPDLSGDTPVHVREWRSWLARVWQQEVLVEVITHLEARPDVRRRLPVVASNLGFVRGDRVVVPCQEKGWELSRD